MNFNEYATFIVVIAAGLTGLTIIIFLCYLLVSYLKYARPLGEAERREHFPMDRGIHKAQMGAKRAKEA